MKNVLRFSLFTLLADSARVKAESLDETLDKVTMNAVIDTLRVTLLDILQNFISHIPYLIAGIIVLLVTALIANLVGRVVYKLAKRARLRGSLQDLLRRLASILTWVFGLLLAAMLVFPGLTPTKALGGVGLLSVAIGFAFRDMFENFFAGVLLLWKFPFENGDYIACEDLMGRVEDITVRMTKLHQVDGELIIVPNSFLFKAPVFVLTDKNRRRTSRVVGIAYGEDVDAAISVIKAALENCDTIDSTLPLQVFMKEFAASSVDIEITWWTDSHPVGLRRSHDEVVAAVKRGLDEADIEIPFPYRTLVFKNPLQTQAINGTGKSSD